MQCRHAKACTYPRQYLHGCKQHQPAAAAPTFQKDGAPALHKNGRLCRRLWICWRRHEARHQAAPLQCVRCARTRARGPNSQCPRSRLSTSAFPGVMGPRPQSFVRNLFSSERAFEVLSTGALATRSKTAITAKMLTCACVTSPTTHHHPQKQARQAPCALSGNLTPDSRLSKSSRRSGSAVYTRQSALCSVRCRCHTGADSGAGAAPSAWRRSVCKQGGSMRGANACKA